MSSALVRQALALVDPEVNAKKKRGARRAPYPVAGRGQGGFASHIHKSKKPVSESSKPPQQLAEENIKKLLALSQPTADAAVAEKIVQRAIKGKPLADKIEIRTEEQKSILFPEDETFKTFEKEYFCS